MCMYNFSFIHLTLGGHLGCFHLLGVVNNAAASRMYRYLSRSLPSCPWDMCPEHVAEQHGGPLFNLLRDTLFFTAAAPFYK